MIIASAGEGPSRGLLRDYELSDGTFSSTTPHGRRQRSGSGDRKLWLWWKKLRTVGGPHSYTHDNGTQVDGLFSFYEYYCGRWDKSCKIERSWLAVRMIGLMKSTAFKLLYHWRRVLRFPVTLCPLILMYINWIGIMPWILHFRGFWQKRESIQWGVICLIPSLPY